MLEVCTLYEEDTVLHKVFKAELESSLQNRPQINKELGKVKQLFDSFMTNFEAINMEEFDKEAFSKVMEDMKQLNSEQTSLKF